MTNYQKSRKDEVCRLTGYWLVLIMACLQAFYAFQAFVDPVSFASFRGTPLMKVDDADWVRIYVSRTLFVALIVGFFIVSQELHVTEMDCVIWAGNATLRCIACCKSSKDLGHNV